VAAKALDDDTYRRQLREDPAGVLRQAGLTVPEGVRVVVHENTADEIHLVLPTGPHQQLELSSEETNLRTLSTGIHF
jgi:hypothetical protein